MASDEPVYSIDNLPGQPERWPRYRKRLPTRAIRIDGPFAVETSEEGLVRCEDGYLAVDARGYPYPIAVEEFALIYRYAPSRRRGGTRGE